MTLMGGRVIEFFAFQSETRNNREAISKVSAGADRNQVFVARFAAIFGRGAASFISSQSVTIALKSRRTRSSESASNEAPTRAHSTLAGASPAPRGKTSVLSHHVRRHR